MDLVWRTVEDPDKALSAVLIRVVTPAPSPGPRTPDIAGSVFLS